MDQYFEHSKCDLMPYMPVDNCYQGVHIQDDEQRDHNDPEQNDQNPTTEQRDREEPQAQKQHQRTKASRVQPQNSSSSQNQEVSGSAAPPPTQYMNYVPMIPSRPGHLPPPWPASPMAIAEEFPFPISGTPHPPPTEGCVYMPFGGYGPPPPGAVALSGPHPFMPLPSPPLNVTGIGEPRRSLHPNGEDLPVDMVTLRYFYNMGVDLHWRMSHHTPPDELGMFGYHQQNNTDQQAGRTVVIGATEDNLTAVESTPPPSPEVANATEQSPLEKSAYAKRNLNSVKVRGKRPEQLQDIKDSLGPAAFLPTPTPSPSSNGSQFSFYTTPSPHHHLITPPRLLQPPPPPPIFYHKAGPPQLGGAAQGQVGVIHALTNSKYSIGNRHSTIFRLPTPGACQLRWCPPMRWSTTITWTRRLSHNNSSQPPCNQLPYLSNLSRQLSMLQRVITKQRKKKKRERGQKTDHLKERGHTDRRHYIPLQLTAFKI